MGNYKKKSLPSKDYDVASSQIKHQLREALNAMYGYNQQFSQVVDVGDANLALDLQGCVDKLSKAIEKVSAAHVKDLMPKTNKYHWCKVLWISDSIASFVFRSDVDGLVVDQIDSKAAQSCKISNREYQIILIDESVLDLLSWDFQTISESSLIVEVGERYHYKHRNFHTANISHNRLLFDYQTYLPKMWQNYVRIKTVQKVNDNMSLSILSIEDNPDSQSALKQLMALYEFIEVEVCYNAEQARDIVFERPFDLIVLDLGLPDSPSDSGYDFALSIRDIQKTKGDFLCPMIINTGHEFTLSCEALFRCGANEFYRKPDLIRNLDSILADYVPKSIIENSSKAFFC